ncbi:hypothetical protein B0J18DRAFT_480288 [Chaetomium sp. MPI-SDFR-AT-0129]|nr:hypothetical protein B0J18DRAFT_480288 [Chaetomium sp. MPI-SDFR-AT-0129]
MWIQCWPVAKLWTPGMKGTCWPNSVVENYQTFANAYSSVLDLILTVLPWKIIWGVAINKKEKLGALIAMSCGVFSAIMSFLKIISLKELGDDNSTNVDVKIFGTVEPAVTIIAISIPVLRAFIRKDAASKSRSIWFIQFSHITEPTTGRSAPSFFEKTYAGNSDMGLVSQFSMPSQVSAARHDVKVYV